MLPALAFAALLQSAPEYRVVAVERHAVFAGRLGERVSETLTLERDGVRTQVRLAGEYHTACVRSALRAGDAVAVLGGIGPTVARRRVVRVP